MAGRPRAQRVGERKEQQRLLACNPAMMLMRVGGQHAGERLETLSRRQQENRTKVDGERREGDTGEEQRLQMKHGRWGVGAMQLKDGGEGGRREAGKHESRAVEGRV